MCKHILILDVNPDDLLILADFAQRTTDKDGFGLIARTKEGDILTYKTMSLADFYMRVGALLSTDTLSQIVVHHRTSTNGDGVAYAHPFEYEGHYLTHNGVVLVPGEHDTKTNNDSEALLHHLVKTNYQTESVSGYFSCFVLNDAVTTVLVDNTAPMYTDGRVYSSHKLTEKMTRVACVKIDIAHDGATTTAPIVVSQSDYGADLRYLSLGTSGDLSSDMVRVEEFLTALTNNDFDLLESCLTESEFYRVLGDIAAAHSFDLDGADYEYLLEFFGVGIPAYNPRDYS